MKSSILVVGPLPPPVHGASNVNQKVLDGLRSLQDVAVSNLSPGKLQRDTRYYLRRLWSLMTALPAIVRNGLRPRPKLYMSVDGGSGAVLNIAIVALARIMRHRVVLHHHSFSYITNRTRLIGALTAVAGCDAKHIFLCNRMKETMCELYPSIGASLVVPNFIDSAHDQLELRPLFSGNDIVVGHLSNLCAEKGLTDFTDLIRSGSKSETSVPLRGILAGPAASDEAEAAISAAINEFGEELDYRGPVYNDDKERFFKDIDVFIFPTHYTHEAQPLVLFEAMSYGIPIVTFDRGCISDDLSNYMSLVLDETTDFVAITIRTLLNWQSSSATTRHRQVNLKSYQDFVERNKSLWDAFISDIASK